ncbi:MAG: DUF5359 family protein [Bacillota bacterium]
MDYDKWLQRFTTRVERFVFRFTLIVVVLLFLVQAVLMNDHLRPYLSYTDQFEGRALQEDLQKVIAGKVEQGKSQGLEEPAVLLELIPPPGEKPPDLTLFVNGKPYAPLGEERLYLPVSAGDLLEVAGHVYGSKPAIVRIAETHGNLQAPTKGSEIFTFGEKELVAWIIP